ncbi:MAG: hypothetical protein ACTIJ2_12515 [Sphingobacteriaceae bacterium]
MGGIVNQTRRLAVCAAWALIPFTLIAQQIGQLDHNFVDLLLPPDPEGISGADGALSIDLGEGQSLFIWGDSFLGPIRNDRRLPSSKFILGNTATLWNGRTAQSLYGGTFEDPKPFIQVESTEHEKLWYWPGDGYLQGDQILLFLSKYGKKQGESGPFSFVYRGCDLLTLDRKSLQILSQEPFLNRSSPIHYGHGLLRKDQYLYIYGSKVDHSNFRAELHVMRLIIQDSLLDGTPAYWDGQRWNPDPDSSHPIAGIKSAISEQFSIRELNGKIVLLNQDRYQTPGQIYTYQSIRPEGPFRNQTRILTIHEPNLEQDSLFTYNAMMHPQIRRNDHILVSYNVNTFSSSIGWKKASVYRPRFLWVPLRAIQ